MNQAPRLTKPVRACNAVQHDRPLDFVYDTTNIIPSERDFEAQTQKAKERFGSDIQDVIMSMRPGKNVQFTSVCSGTSGDERQGAAEHKPTSNVVRAKYAPFVGGINRYKYFSQPVRPKTAAAQGAKATEPQTPQDMTAGGGNMWHGRKASANSLKMPFDLHLLDESYPPAMSIDKRHNSLPMVVGGIKSKYHASVKSSEDRVSGASSGYDSWTSQPLTNFAVELKLNSSISSDGQSSDSVPKRAAALVRQGSLPDIGSGAKGRKQSRKGGGQMARGVPPKAASAGSVKRFRRLLHAQHVQRQHKAERNGEKPIHNVTKSNSIDCVVTTKDNTGAQHKKPVTAVKPFSMTPTDHRGRVILQHETEIALLTERLTQLQLRHSNAMRHLRNTRPTHGAPAKDNAAAECVANDIKEFSERANSPVSWEDGQDYVDQATTTDEYGEKQMDCANCDKATQCDVDTKIAVVQTLHQYDSGDTMRNDIEIESLQLDVEEDTDFEYDNKMDESFDSDRHGQLVVNFVKAAICVSMHRVADYKAAADGAAMKTL